MIVEYAIDMEYADVKYNRRTKTFTVLFHDPNSAFIPTSCTIKKNTRNIAFVYLSSLKWNDIRHSWEAKYTPFDEVMVKWIDD